MTRPTHLALMSALQRTSRSYSVSSDAILASTPGRAAVAAVLVAVACYGGGLIAMAVVVPAFGGGVGYPLYPPYAILLAGLLLTRPRYWWMLLLAMAISHQASGIDSRWDPSHILADDVVNAGRALVAAAGLRSFARRPLFGSLEGVAAFIGIAVLAAPAVGALVGAAVSVAFEGGRYWQKWETWFVPNGLAALIFLPSLLIGLTSWPYARTRPSVLRVAEAAVLIVAMIGAAALAAAGSGPGMRTALERFAVSLPLLVWAAVRFGPAGTSLSLLFISTLAIVSAARGVGPFVASSSAESLRSLHVFLGLVSAPLLMLAALVRERERTIEALNGSQNRYRLATSAGGVTVWDWRCETNDLHLDAPMHASLGFGDAEIGTSIGAWQARLHPDDVARVSAQALSLRDGTTPWFETEYRLLHKDGSTRWFHTRGAVIWEANGKMRGLIGTQTDITERKRVEESLHESEKSLRESEERTSMAANAAHLGYWQRSLDDDAMWLSDDARQLYGLPAGAPVTSGTVDALKHADDRERIRVAVQAAIDARSTFDVEFRAVWPNGETHWLRKRGSPRLDASGVAICLAGVLVDITERKRMLLAAEEELKELAHLGRVAMVGDMSTALAHELSQPLAAILCNAHTAKQLLAIEPRDIPQVSEILDDIVRDDSRAAEVIRQLRSLIKKADPVFQPLHVAALVGEALSILRSELLARRVAVTTDFAASLPTVMGDRVQLLQVLLNLILNACDAMHDVPVIDRRLTLSARADDVGQVIVSVSDAGTRISAERLETVFDPFVTTKAAGLGLGLAICRSIVGAHEGSLWAANNPDGGAVVHLALPVQPSAVQETVYPPPMSPYRVAVQ